MKEIAGTIIKAFKNENKLFVVGNGGSATMASHLVGELQGKFKHERRPLPAMTLFDLATITAIANDYGYKWIFHRQLEALAKPGDVLLILSTSGESENALMAYRYAIHNSMEVIDLPRKGNTTAKIQENHLKMIHEIARRVERAFL